MTPVGWAKLCRHEKAGWPAWSGHHSRLAWSRFPSAHFRWWGFSCSTPGAVQCTQRTGCIIISSYHLEGFLGWVLGVAGQRRAMCSVPRHSSRGCQGCSCEGSEEGHLEGTCKVVVTLHVCSWPQCRWRQTGLAKPRASGGVHKRLFSITATTHVQPSAVCFACSLTRWVHSSHVSNRWTPGHRPR